MKNNVNISNDGNQFNSRSIFESSIYSMFFLPFQITSRYEFEDPLNRFPKNEGLDKPWCDPALVAKKHGFVSKKVQLPCLATC